jgi:hypothetical protein
MKICWGAALVAASLCLAPAIATAQQKVASCIQTKRYMCDDKKGCQTLVDAAPNQWSFRFNEGAQSTVRVERCSGGHCGQPFTANYKVAFSTITVIDPSIGEVFQIHMDSKRYVHTGSTSLPESMSATSEFGFCSFN